MDAAPTETGRGLEELVAALESDDSATRIEAARELGKRGDQRAVLPLYELAKNELADEHSRVVAAEALVKLGLLRPADGGPSPILIWLLGITLLIAAIASASTLGMWAVFVFVIGVAALAAHLVIQRRRSVESVYIGPAGERIRVRRRGVAVDEGDTGPWPTIDGPGGCD